MNKNCWGTYIHGIFDNDSFRQMVLNQVRRAKGLSPSASQVSYGESQEKALDRLAAMVRDNLDMEFIQRMIA